MTREKVTLSPLYYTAVAPPAGRAGAPTGYIRLTNFTSNAAAEMQDAIKSLQVSECE